jgi:hypothetical protein
MARLVSLTTLQNRVLQRAHLPAASNAGIVSSPELVDNINEGIAELYGLIVRQPGQPYYLESINFATSANSDTYAIGPGQAINIADFLEARGFDIQFGQNIVNTAKPFMWSERNRFKLLYSGWIYTQPVFYRMTGKSSAVASSALDSVKFIPVPSGQFTCTMWYHPTPPVLVNPSDVFDGINGYEELAVLSAAIKLLIKQEQFEHAQALMGERARQEEKVLSLLVHDAEAPERVTDVTLNDDGWLGRPVY